MKFLDLRRTASRRRCLGLLVMLAFGFKALIPAGYMLAAVDGHLRLAICPAGIHYLTGMHAMAGMVQTSGMDHGAHGPAAGDQCPFALAGGAAVLAAAGEPAEPNFVILQPVRARDAASVPIAPPSRYHAPRGPPSLA
jgi:hypothetical protein